MKTKAFLLKTIILSFMVATLFSCKKSASTSPTTPKLSSLNGSWSNTEWGGVSGNDLTFSINESTAIGTVTLVGSQPFGFVVGDKLLTNITASASGSFSATGMYTYGTDNSMSSTRPCTITLQNSGTQMTIDYPAINVDYPEIVYGYQKGAVTQ